MNSLAFAAWGLAGLARITSEILGYTHVIKNIRLEISNIRSVIYFM